MKKTLMALSLAFCATVAFAQMPKSARVDRAANEVTTKVSTSFNVNEMQRQDAFKGSIFTKTPIFTEDFTLQNGKFSVGRTTGNLYQNANYAQWQWIADTTPSAVRAAASAMPVLFGASNQVSLVYRTGGSLSGVFESQSGGGFMAMSMQDQIGDPDWGGSGTIGIFDSWIAFKGVQPQAGNMYDVSFFQLYKKFNQDSCFLEYSSDSTNWNTLYINRRGVDMAVNASFDGVKTVALPLGVDQYQDLYVRLRWYADTNPGGAYGYYWLVDDVSIDTASTNRISIYNRNMLDGGYQLVPKGMGGNAFLWYSTFRNTGGIDQENVIAAIKSSNGTTLASSQNVALLNPDAINDTFLYIDPTGRMYNYYASTSHTFGTTGYVPSTTAGIDSLFIGVTSDSLNFKLDTIKFNVNEDANGNHIWGRDNGILTGYNAWTNGMTPDGFRTSDANTGEADYSLRVMYCTPATVPQGWVIRGVEIVPATRTGYALAGAKLDAHLSIDSADATGEHIYFKPQSTGASTYTVQSSEITDFIPGYQAFGSYNTIRITFPLQPALRANQKYWIGYTMSEAGTFAPAVNRNYYFDNDSVGQLLPNHYNRNFGGGASSNVFVLQPSCAQTTVYSFADMGTPMIRMIVGPEQVIPNYNITWNVTPANGGTVTDMTDYSDVTGQTVSKPQGSTITFAIEPNLDDNFDLIDLSVNGNPIDMTTDPNFVARGEYYLYDVANLQADVTCLATFSDGAVDVANNAVVKVQPNPASSVANLTVEGVNGDVNFALIDMNGRVISQKVINANATEQINLEGLARGTYFVRITNNHFSKVEKLIVR